MHRSLYGALMGLLIGGPAVLFVYQILLNVADRGIWATALWVVIFVAWGAVLGFILPKPKA